MATTKRTSPAKKSARSRKASTQERTGIRALRSYPSAAALAVSTAFAPMVWVQAVLAEPAANQLPSDKNYTVVNQPGSTVPSATVSSSGTTMQVNQAGDKAVINWDCFCIGRNAWVNITQPSASSVILNRSVQ